MAKCNILKFYRVKYICMAKCNILIFYRVNYVWLIELMDFLMYLNLSPYFGTPTKVILQNVTENWLTTDKQCHVR